MIYFIPIIKHVSKVSVILNIVNWFFLLAIESVFGYFPFSTKRQYNKK